MATLVCDLHTVGGGVVAGRHGDAHRQRAQDDAPAA